MSPLFAGTSQFDPDARRTATISGVGGVAYGGLGGSRAAVVPSGAVGLCHHGPSLYATGHLASLPPPGTVGFVSDPAGGGTYYEPPNTPDFWEVPPGWAGRGGRVRRPRLLLVLPSLEPADPDGMGRTAVAAAVAAEFDSLLRPLGVAVCITHSLAARFRPLAAAVPAAMLGVELIGTGPAVYRLRPTYPDPDALRGGDVLVLELNPSRWTYGGMPASGGSISQGATSAYTFSTFDPAPHRTGATTFPFSGSFLGSTISAYAFGAEAAVDLPAARALAARSHSYRHLVYAADRYHQLGVGAVDDAGIYATLYGGADFAERRVVATGDPAATWARIRADVLAFFG